MVRSFLNAFQKLLKEPGVASNPKSAKSHPRTHAYAVVPSNAANSPVSLKPAATASGSGRGTILTGEMFARILAEQISKYNALTGSRLSVLAVPNTYFGGDVAVAGLLSGRDFLNVREQIDGDFVIIPRHTIKSDEPIFMDGMTFEELKRSFDVPVFDLDLPGFLEFLGG
jgi:hypothetical protein